MKRMRMFGALGLALVLLGGCATSQALRRARTAESQGNWDAAVGYYREALGRNPDRTDLVIGLARASRQAARVHYDRARTLEEQNQLAAALQEYRVASSLDPGTTVYTTRARMLEQRLRAAEEASRPPTPLQQAQTQAAAQSPIPQLDPRTLVPELSFPSAAVRDILGAIEKLTGITISYDRTDPALDTLLNRPYTINVRNQPLETVLQNVLSMNQLTFKVLAPTQIFVYQDNPQKRAQFEELYFQVFPLSYADPQEITQLLQQLVVQGAGTRARVVPTKTRNTVSMQAPASMLRLAESIIRAHDKPQAEVLIQAEILEVSRAFVRRIGLDLSQFALGFTWSPVEAPPLTAGVPEAFPEMPPPINLSDLTGEPRTGSFYMTAPTALIRLLETDSNTKVLARPHIQGSHGAQMILRLGANVPVPRTTFQSQGAGGVATIPTTSFDYLPVGINLTFTPRITLDGDVILENLVVEKSDLGLPIVIAGQSLPTIDSRNATSSMRLRDGQPSMLAGLFRDEDRTEARGLPGVSRVPGLRNIFGSSDTTTAQTEIVMFITPHIIRTSEITPEDLTPIPVGTAQNIGGSNMPQLAAPGAVAGAAPTLPLAGTLGAGGVPPAAPAPAAAGAEIPPVVSAPIAPPPIAPGVVPIRPVESGAAPAVNAAPTPAESAGSGRITLVAPSPGPGGTLQAGGGPYAVPIQVSGMADVGTLSLTITYDPTVLTTPTVTQGSFMMQGGISPTFMPKVDTAAGRIDLVFSRPGGQAGASGSGVLGAVAFVGGAPGTGEITITGVATSSKGQSIPLQFTPARVTVK
jgi:general secretion pathway protein D